MGLLKESIDFYRAKEKTIKDENERKKLWKEFWLGHFLETVNLKIFVLPFTWLLEKFYLDKSKIFLIPTNELPFDWHNNDQFCVGMKCGYILYIWELKQEGERKATIIIKPAEETIWNKMIKKNPLTIPRS